MVKGLKNIEVGLIPGDWKVKKIGEIVDKFVNGGTPSTKNENYWLGNIPWITGADILEQKIEIVRRYITNEAVKNSSTNIIKKNSILFVSRTGVGKIAIAPFDVAISQDFTGIYVNDIKVDTMFLFRYFDFNQNKLKSLNQGTSIQGITRETLSSMLIPLPPTIEEQKAIATALNDTDELISKLDKLIDKKRAIKQGAMQELLKPKEGWKVLKLGDVTDITKLAGFEYSNYFNSYKDGGDIIVIRGTNITNNKMDLSDVKYIPTSVSNKLKRSKLNKNDLVFAYVGTIGPVFLVDEDDKYHLGPNTSKITPKKEITPLFLYHYFTSSNLYKEIVEHTSIGAQPSLSMFKIRRFQLNLPSIIEQKRIAQILSDMESEIEGLKKKLEKLQNLKQGMMQNLLTGKIRLI